MCVVLKTTVDVGFQRRVMQSKDKKFSICRLLKIIFLCRLWGNHKRTYSIFCVLRNASYDHRGLRSCIVRLGVGLLFSLFCQLKPNSTCLQLHHIIVKKYIYYRKCCIHIFHFELRISKLDWKENTQTGIPFEPFK